MAGRNKKPGFYWLCFFAISYVVIVVGFYSNNFEGGLSKDTGTWGTFGDYVGGVLNPFFAFLSFIALLTALRYQSDQLERTDDQLKLNEDSLYETRKAIKQNEIALEQNAKALELNNKELANSNHQLSITAKAQEEMQLTQKIQQFEGLFTYMANELGKIYEFLHNNKGPKNFSSFLDEDGFYTSAQINLKKDYHLTRYFIYLYQILKYVDEQKFSHGFKKRYLNLIRSSLDNNILQILYLNCVCSGYADDFKNYNKLVTKYGFFEHMSFDSPASEGWSYKLIYLSRYYNDMAFGSSDYFLDLKSNINCKIIFGFYKNWHPKNFLKHILFSKSYDSYSSNVLEGFCFSLDLKLCKPNLVLSEKKTGNRYIVDTDKSKLYVFTKQKIIFELDVDQVGVILFNISEAEVDISLEIKSSIFSGDKAFKEIGNQKFLFYKAIL